MLNTKAYIIVNPDEQIYLSTIRIRRTDCVRDFEKNYSLDWREYCNNGWKCIKIKIVIDKPLIKPKK